MDKPKKLIDNDNFNDQEREKLIDFFLDWAVFYETVSYGGVHISAIAEKIGYPLKDFEERLALHKNQNVYESIKKAWLYGKRPLTLREICSMFNKNFSETNIRKQVSKLCKNGYLKAQTVKIMGKDIDFYYIPREKKVID